MSYELSVLWKDFDFNQLYEGQMTIDNELNASGPSPGPSTPGGMDLSDAWIVTIIKSNLTGAERHTRYTRRIVACVWLILSTGGIHRTIRGITTKDYDRAYELTKYWRKLQGPGNLMASENASTARDIDAEASSMQTDDNIRGIEADEQRALGIVDDRVCGSDFQGNNDYESEAPSFGISQYEAARKILHEVICACCVYLRRHFIWDLNQNEKQLQVIQRSGRTQHAASPYDRNHTTNSRVEPEADIILAIVLAKTFC